MAKVTPLAGGILQIDTEMGGIENLCASYVVPGPNPAVIETGPATVARTLFEGLAEAGIGPADVASFVVTHIHLDHAGAAGDLAELFPNASVVVHREGARHLQDPSKLMASAARVFGPALDKMFGVLRPVPPDRIRAVDAGDTVEIGGGRRLEIVEATGHARHHMAIQDSDTGAIVVGDAMGVFMPETGLLRPAAPPPDFHLEQAIATLRRIRARDPGTLLFAHFGPAPASRDMLAESEERLLRFGAVVLDAMADTADVDEIARRLEEETAPEYAALEERPDLKAKFEALNAFRSSAAGYLRYFQQHGAKLPGDSGPAERLVEETQRGAVPPTAPR